MTNPQITAMADRIGADPREVERAIKLARTGRTDLVGAVIDGRMTIEAALRAASNTPYRNPPQKRRRPRWPNGK
jgi:hypothetical protein